MFKKRLAKLVSVVAGDKTNVRVARTDRSQARGRSLRATPALRARAALRARRCAQRMGRAPRMSGKREEQVLAK